MSSDTYNETREIDTKIELNSLLQTEPKAVYCFVPHNILEQKRAFLSDEIEDPSHIYGRLKKIDFARVYAETNRFKQTVAQLDLPEPIFKDAYMDFADESSRRTKLLEIVTAYNDASEIDTPGLARDFMSLNIELHSEPDKQLFESLFIDKVNKIKQKDLTSDARRILAELLSRLEFDVNSGITVERFTPSPQTLEWMHAEVMKRYGRMIDRVPRQEEFNVSELKQIFLEILRNDFGGDADDWRVDIEPARSIDVKPPEKRIVIPEDRGILNYEKVCSLVVHELGAHVTRAINGAKTGFDLLAVGLADYESAEEGIGVVMEQSLLGRYTDRGAEHHITAGLAYFGNRDFRSVFEVKWRLSLLEQIGSGEDVSDKLLQDARELAYSETMRIFRGTDKLPWFKDLAYYNGAIGIWQFLESHFGDSQAIDLMLAGKIDPNKPSNLEVVR